MKTRTTKTRMKTTTKTTKTKTMIRPLRRRMTIRHRHRHRRTPCRWQRSLPSITKTDAFQSSWHFLNIFWPYGRHAKVDNLCRLCPI